VNTLQRGLSGVFDLFKGGGGEVGYPHGSKGGGYGGCFPGGGIKKPPMKR